ncbi:hypothetical protein A1O1_00235 [Capronia coronata CBS 617.96]|uniref:Uncharacterized protein n=1 Tax=Capronia coronata CBS 617.96 TaxID=1182541 RepID=W9Z0M0_9EURO|nr:uncharacterized protein A1O1_00235 [Capronia coronata CBS 617.96]EXJ95116.1 hypothetical protein A1O1_00235 [Capronia coronata CBS 617.96]
MAAKPDRPQNSPRKSLKQSLKDIFLRKLRKPPSPCVRTVGSGILRRGGPSDSFISSVYTFSPLESAGNLWSPDHHTISRGIPNRFQTPTNRSTSRFEARQSLLPATSLSHFNLHHDYLQQLAVPQGTVHQAISPTFTSLVSQQASIAPFSPSPSTSSLKLRDSSVNLVHRDSFKHLPSPSSARQLQQGRGQNKQVSWNQSATTSSVSVPDHDSDEEHAFNSEDHAGIRQVEHFKSICVLDTALPGCPVVATSEELRYIFELGEHFFLNSFECEGTSIDIITGQDAAGEPITHLVLFTPLVIPSSGRSRFMLASLVDVTRFIHDAASLPEPDKGSNRSTIVADCETPFYTQDIRWSFTACKLSAEDLLGGCVLPQDRDTPTNPIRDPTDDIWVDLANEERSRTSTARNTPRSTPGFMGTPRSSDASTASKTSITVDDVLDDFMSSLQELYSNFFLLGKSPLDDTYFEICNVSPMLYEAEDYIHGHLSRTGERGLADLSTRLAYGSPFHARVKWGMEGQDKRLYCSPLYGHNSTTWICFLLEPNTPDLW